MIAKKTNLNETATLDLGCGLSPRNPFQAERVFGVDIRDNPNKCIKCTDLIVEPIPFEDNAFDFITAFDFLEHIPRIVYAPHRRFPFVELMNEVWRTLKPNGYFLSHTPVYRYSEIYRDPTHVNVITYQTFTAYFDDVHRDAGMYGFKGSFKVVGQYINAPHLITILQKTAG